MSDRATPMPLAEADECCGQYRCAAAMEDRAIEFEDVCDNCPLLIDRSERVMQAARAL